MELPSADSIDWIFRPQACVSQAGFAPVADAQISGPKGPVGFYPQEQYQLVAVQSYKSDGCVEQDQLHAAQQPPVPEGTHLERLPPRTDFEHLQQKYAELREALDLWQRRASGAQQQADATNTHLLELQRENWMLGSEVVKLRQEVALLGGNISGQLSIVQGAVFSELQAELADRLGQVGALQEEVGVLVAQLQAAERDAAAATAAAAAERDRLASELGTARLMATARGRGAEGLQAQLAQLSEAAAAEAADLRSQLAASVARAEAAEAAAAEAAAAAEQRRAETEELRQQLLDEREAKERTAAELEVVRYDARDLRAANECLEASLEAHLEGQMSACSNGGGTNAALLQLHAELRRLQHEEMTERHSLQEALARAQEAARTAAHQVAYLRQLQEVGSCGAGTAGKVAFVLPASTSASGQQQAAQPPLTCVAPRRHSMEALRSDMTGVGSTSSSSCCGGVSGILSDNDGSSSAQQQQQQQQGHWPARVRELICSMQSLEEQLTSERDRADGLQRLVSELQEQLQAALCGSTEAPPFGCGSGHPTTATADGGAVRGCRNATVGAADFFHHEAGRVTSDVSEGVRTSSAATSDLDAAAAAAAMAEARSLAHSLFSDDDEDNEEYNEYADGGGTVLGTIGSDTGRSWLERTVSGPSTPFHVSTLEAAVQTDEQVGAKPGGDGAAATAAASAAVTAAASQTNMLLAAAREEIERLKELNARLAAAKDPRRYVAVEKVQAALAEERQRLRREADEAMAAEAGMASRRYEALAAAHGSLQAEVQSLRSELQAAREEAQATREAQVSELQRRLEGASEQLEAARARAERLGEQLEQVRAEAEADAAAALVEAHTASAAATELHLAALRKNLATEHEAALEALRMQLVTAHESALAESQARHQTQLEKLRQRHAEEVAELRTQPESAAAEAAARHAAQVAELQKRHDAELAELRAELDEVCGKAAAQVMELQRNHAEQLVEMQQERANREEEAAVAAAAAAAGPQQEHAERLARLSEDYAAQVAELRDQHVGEVEGLCEQHAAEVEALCSQHAAEVEGLRKEHAAEVDGLRRQLREAAEMAARRLAAAEAAAVRERQLGFELEAAVAAERLAGAEDRKRLEETLRGRHAEERQALDLEVGRLRDGLRALEEQLQLREQEHRRALEIAVAEERECSTFERSSETEREESEKVAALESELAKRNAELARQAAQSEVLCEKHRRELAALQATHGSVMAEAAARHAANLRDLQISHVHELGELRCRLEAAQGSAIDEYATKVAELQRRHNTEIANIRADLDVARGSAIASADAQHAAQIEEMARRHERELAKLGEKLEAAHGLAMTQVEKRHAAHLGELTRRYEQELSMLRQQHAVALQATAAAHAEQAATLAKQYDTLYKERLAATAKALREAHHSELRRVAATMGAEAAAAAAALREQMEAQVVEEVAAAVNTIQLQQQMQQGDGKGPAASVASSSTAAAAAPMPLGDRTNGQRALPTRPPLQAAGAQMPPAAPPPRALATNLAGQVSPTTHAMEPEAAVGLHAQPQRFPERRYADPLSTIAGSQPALPSAAGGGFGSRMGSSLRAGSGCEGGSEVVLPHSDVLRGSGSSNGSGSVQSGGGETDGGLQRPPPPEICSSPRLQPATASTSAAAPSRTRGMVFSADDPPIPSGNRASGGVQVPAVAIPAAPLRRTASVGGCNAAAEYGHDIGSHGDVLESLLGRTLLSSRAHRDRSLAQEARAAQHATVAAQHEARLHSLRSGRLASSSVSACMPSSGYIAAQLVATMAAPPPRPLATAMHAATADANGKGVGPASVVAAIQDMAGAPAGAVMEVAARARATSARSARGIESSADETGLASLQVHRGLEGRSEGAPKAMPTAVDAAAPLLSSFPPGVKSDGLSAGGSSSSKSGVLAPAPAMSLSLSDLSAATAAAMPAGGGATGAVTRSLEVRRLFGGELAAAPPALPRGAATTGARRRGSEPGHRYVQSGSMSDRLTVLRGAGSTGSSNPVDRDASDVADRVSSGSITMSLAQLSHHLASTGSRSSGV